MIAPKWLNTKTQPLGIRDVLSFLHKALHKKELYNTSYDVFTVSTITRGDVMRFFRQEDRGLWLFCGLRDPWVVLV